MLLMGVMIVEEHHCPVWLLTLFDNARAQLVFVSMAERHRTVQVVLFGLTVVAAAVLLLSMMRLVALKLLFLYQGWLCECGVSFCVSR